MRKKRFSSLLFRVVFIAAVWTSTPLSSDCDMCHTLIFAVEPMNYFGQILGPSPAFTIQGEQSSVTWTNTYSVSTNEVNKKIVASLDNNLPKGCFLQVSLSPPTGARTLGMQTLSTTPTDLVVEISKTSASGLPMVYRFTTHPKAGVIPNATRIVTYTLIDG